MTEYIFYKNEPHCFSNFHEAKISIDLNEWPTSEHYFQAMKFYGIDNDLYEAIRRASSPAIAYRLGRSKKIREDWDNIRNKIMKRALIAKFTQHEYLKKLLINTGNRMIYQRCKIDKYWGDGGGPCKGENMLGILLMEVRDEIKKGDD